MLYALTLHTLVCVAFGMVVGAVGLSLLIEHARG